jgi:hypothetical protein
MVSSRPLHRGLLDHSLHIPFISIEQSIILSNAQVEYKSFS